MSAVTCMSLRQVFFCQSRSCSCLCIWMMNYANLTFCFSVPYFSYDCQSAIYKYQIFWVLLLLWKMYLSLLFQVSPLIEPTVDILAHVQTLSISTRTYLRYLSYLQIGVLWTPFVLVYLFDTIIWYFLWQAIWGLL